MATDDSRQPTEPEQQDGAPVEDMAQNMNVSDVEANEIPNEASETIDDLHGGSGESEKLQQELDETKNQLLRAHADFDNFRRRTRQEKEDLQKFATKKLLGDLLPVVDNLDRALASVASDGSQGDWVTGVDMVRRQLVGVLEQHGVTAMECLGAPFDPNLHEAVMQEPASEQGPGVICGELQRGYWLAGKVLRPAMVKVTV